jgi:phage-related protein
MGFALWQAQAGGQHVDAKPLKGFDGAGALEVVEDHDGNADRAADTVKLAGAAYVLHAFRKESKRGAKTPRAERDLIRQRLTMAEGHHDGWRAAQEGRAEDGAGGGR